MERMHKKKRTAETIAYARVSSSDQKARFRKTKGDIGAFFVRDAVGALR